MDEIKAYLVEWTLLYIKNRDVMERNLEETKENVDGFDIFAKYRSNEKYFYVSPFFADFADLLKVLDKDKFIVITAFNTSANVKLLLDNWKTLSEYPKLSIIFMNPFASHEKKWMIMPYTHSRIADNSSLKLGITSLAEGVGYVTEEQLARAIR